MKYIGLSPKHASSVPLVLNPFTGFLTAQFHEVFDDWFATVSAAVSDLPDLNSDEWSKMFNDSTYQYLLDEDVFAQLQSESAVIDTDMDPADAISASRINQHRDHTPLAHQPLITPSNPMLPESLNQRERAESDVKLDPSSSVPLSSQYPMTLNSDPSGPPPLIEREPLQTATDSNVPPIAAPSLS